MKSINYYLSVSAPEDVLTEINGLDIFQRCMLVSVLCAVAALKSSQNFGAAKYHYALIKCPECKTFAMSNHFIDILNLAAAIAMNTYDMSVKNNKGK